MGYARTQRGAAYRVKLKRGLRSKGVKVANTTPTKELERKYRKHIGPVSRPRKKHRR